MSSSTDGRPPPFRGEFMSRRKHNLAAMQDLDAVIVGGCGHVGLPLALSLADCGFRVGINDVDQAKIEMVRAGQVPFRETGAEAPLRTLPQIVGATSDVAFDKARALFERLGVASVIRTTPLEAEIAKLLTNTWRYMKFAIANQFFQIVNRSGLDYNRVLNAVRQDYPRAADLPGPGFAAGPCLLKDTMQLSAFTPDHFPMGQAAMQVNEGLPGYIVDTLNSRRPLLGRTVGILGMAFKGESDDARASLSYKLRKLAQFKGAKVLCTDPYVPDPTFEPLEKVLQDSDVIVVGAPHRAYRELELDGREVVDIWGITGPIRL